MIQSSFWYLENVDLTGLLCPSKMKANPASYTEKSIPKDTYIYMPQDLQDKIYFIEEGRVKIGTYSTDGKEITKAILGPGELFGELALIEQSINKDFALTMEQTTLCIVGIEQMRALMKEHNGLSAFFMNLFGSRRLEMERRLESLVFKDSRTRVIEYLVELVAEKGERVGYEYVVRKFFTHQEIANLTATSRQTVTTLLNDLRSQDIISFDRRRMLVRDLEKLKKF